MKNDLTIYIIGDETLFDEETKILEELENKILYDVTFSLEIKNLLSIIILGI